jgi:purine-nucleoside/S-methyl-5'-thioadenosine phosphorylase / adenosine deaminase
VNGDIRNLNECVLKETDKIKYLSSPILSSFDSVLIHGFLSREGGVSAPPFSSLNFDVREGDPLENVARNKEIIKKASGARMERLILVNQVHGSSVLVLDDFVGGPSSYRLTDADAIITGLTDFPIGILTADCLPILLYDPVNAVAGAVHAGWKGTVRSIVVKTVEAMRARFGTNPRDIICALGPYIGPCCYGVGENVYAEFSDAFGNVDCFKRDSGALRLDIGASNVSQLHEAGIIKDNISISPFCTSCRNDLFFSYRKDNKRTGRQLSFIMLKSNRNEG